MIILNVLIQLKADLFLVGSKNSAWPRHKRLTSADDLLSSYSPSPTEEGGDEEKALPSSRDKIIVENSKEISKEKQQSPKESPKLSALVAESPRLSRFRKLEISADPKYLVFWSIETENNPSV